MAVVHIAAAMVFGNIGIIGSGFITILGWLQHLLVEIVAT